jgi:diguanylate cyclase (GGDEF)-like protein
MFLIVLLLLLTFYLSAVYSRLSEETDRYIRLQNAVHEMMEASDYLTENTQQFTQSGDLELLEAYFKEVNDDRRREEALAILAEDAKAVRAYEDLQLAVNGSVKLMNREYYAMKLVLEANGVREYPDELRAVTLLPHDAVLLPEEKISLARSMVLDEQYYAQKDQIRQNMKNSLEHLEELVQSQQNAFAHGMNMGLTVMRLFIIFAGVAIFLVVWLLSHLTVRPLLDAVGRINANSSLSVSGSREFRHLAKTYNKFYDMYQKSMARLHYKASHDELTKVYNRSGYEILLPSLIMDSTYMLVIDADKFKAVNDTYGHDTGDKVLQRIAQVLRHHFSSEDYVCRIGGDEFVVIMMYLSPAQKDMIIRKVAQINEELSIPQPAVPAVSISVGAAHGEGLSDPSVLFEHADRALYERKRNGRNGVSFYEDIELEQA